MNPTQFAADLASGLTELRAMAEARMKDRVVVRRKTGRKVQNETTGRQEPEWATVHPDIPFRLTGSSSSDGGSHTVSIAGVEYEQATAVGHFPAVTNDLRDGDYIDIVSGEWPGSVYSIVKAIKADQKTARRVPIAEETRPTEWGSP